MQNSTQLQLAETLRRIEAEHSEREKYLIERLDSLEQQLTESETKREELGQAFGSVSTRLDTLTERYETVCQSMQRLTTLLTR